MIDYNEASRSYDSTRRASGDMRIGVMLDRDGTMSPVGGYCHPNDFALLPQEAKAVRVLNEHGVPVVVVTNQTGVRNGRFSKEELLNGFARIDEELRVQGAHLDGIFSTEYREF